MYCTQQDLIDRGWATELIQLTDNAGTGGMDSIAIDRAITDAEADINSYLQGRYALPLPTLPVVLTRIACDIVRYYLYDTRVVDVEPVAKRYEAAIRFLESVAKGTIDLGLDVNNSPVVHDNVIQATASRRVFGRP